MNQFASNLLMQIAMATLALAVATLLTWLVLRLSRTISPTVHRLAWCAVLLVGCSFARLPIEVPWYAPPIPVDDSPIVVTEAVPITREFEPSTSSELHRGITPPVAELAPAAVADQPMDEAFQPVELDPTYSPELPVISGAFEIENERRPSNADTVNALALDRDTSGLATSSSWWRPELSTALAAIWLAGMVSIAAVWLAGYVLFIRRLPPGLPADDLWLDEWRELLAARHVRRQIPLRITNNLGPLLCRLPRGYCLAVPEALWRDLDAVGRATILKHELAHYERGDVWRSLAVRLLALPQWFNPCSWFAVRRFDEAAEWACDRAVADEHSVVEYARTLLQLGTDPHGYASYRPAASGKPLAARVRRLLRLRNEHDSRLKVGIVVLAALAMALFAFVRVELVAQEPPAKATEISSDAPTSTTEQKEAPIDRADDELQPQDRLTIAIDPPPPVDQGKQLTAAQATTDAAKKAYEGNWNAYQNNYGSLDALYIWSLRWLQAAERSPPLIDKEKPAGIIDREHRLNVAKEHLERMKNAQERVKALHEATVPGGERERLLEANFYVAEAEHRIADLEALNGPRVLGTLGPSPGNTATIDAARREAAFAAEAARAGKLAKILQGNDAEARLKQIAQASVAAAKTAYTASLASYQNGSLTLDPVIRWSTEWRNAVKRVPPYSQEVTLSAAKEHLERMQALQKQVKALFETGSLGGQAENMASINFHVAEAERDVAQLEGDPQPVDKRAQLQDDPVLIKVDEKGPPTNQDEAALEAYPQVSIKGPDSAKVGDKVRLDIQILNAGKTAIPAPLLILRYGDGLKHAAARSSPIERELRDLGPGSSTTAQVEFLITKPGTLSSEVEVRGNGKTAIQRHVLNATATGVTPGSTKTSPVSIQVRGPSTQVIGTTAEMNIVVDNQGASSERLWVVVNHDRTLDPVTLTDGYRFVGDSIEWEIAELAPGKQAVIEVNCKCRGLDENATVRASVRTKAGNTSDALASVRIQAAKPAEVADNWQELRYQGKSADEWSEILKTELSEASQIEAIEALGAFATKGQGGEIATLLFEVDPKPGSKIENSILKALYNIPRDTALPLFAKAGKSEDAEIRRLALIALVNTAPDSEQTKTALKAGLHDANWNVVAPALHFLGTWGNQPSYKKARQPLPAMSDLAPDLFAVLARFQEKPNEAPVEWEQSMRLVTIQALARCGSAAKIALPMVLPWLDGNNWSQRELAFTIVDAAGPDATDAVPALIELLKDRVRIEGDQPNLAGVGRPVELGPTFRALKALGVIGPAASEAAPTVLDVATEALQSGTSPTIALSAFQTLAAIGRNGPAMQDTQIALLIDAIEKKKADQVELIKCLGQFGPAAKEAAPLLEKIIKDEPYAPGPIKDAAQAALEKIRAKPVY